jgi:hypothetical protein
VARLREPQEALSTATIALEISSRNARIAALQNALGPAARRPRLDSRPAGSGNGRCPRRRQRVLVRGYKGKNAARLVTRIDCALVSLVAELRGHERRAAKELGQRKTGVEERKTLTSPAARVLALLLTGEELVDARHGPSRGKLKRSAATIAPKISSPQLAASRRSKRWDRLRADLDLILDQRGADMADLPGGASGLLCRDCKGKGVIGW